MYDPTAPEVMARFQVERQVAPAAAGRRRSTPYGAWVAASLLVVAPCVLAQQATPPPAPARNAPPPEDLEPGVNTSATPPPAAPAPAAAAPAAPAARPTSESGSGDTAAPKVGTRSSGARGNGSAKSNTDTTTAPGKTSVSGQASNSGTKGGKAEDHLQLDTTQITGNQELPKVLYIVPWKRSDLGDLLGKPANSLLDEVLQPVDRDVFKRENRYYDALKPDAGSGAAKGAGAAGNEASSEKR